MGSNVDTVVINEPFNIYWNQHQDGKGMVTGEVILGNWWEDSLE